jgi:hypothetical protein
MNQEFLTGWHARTLSSGLREASASWNIEAFDRFNKLPTPRLETKEERDIAVAAIGETLDSLRAKAPYCLAIISMGAIWTLPRQSIEALDMASHEESNLEWVPGDEDFAAGEALRSMIVDLGTGDIAPLYPFFFGMDARCLALFSKISIAPRDIAARLAQQKGHPEALRTIINKGNIAAFPAFDGDVIVFVTEDEEMLSYIIGSKNGREGLIQ